jgi:hypothetical protein
MLYVGFDLSTALLKSVFHKRQWHRRSKRTVSAAEVDARMVSAVGVLDDLTPADLTATGVMATQFGLNLSQLASRRYGHAQRIAKAVHELVNAAGAPRFDGLLSLRATTVRRNALPGRSVSASAAWSSLRLRRTTTSGGSPRSIALRSMRPDWQARCWRAPWRARGATATRISSIRSRSASAASVR